MRMIAGKRLLALDEMLAGGSQTPSWIRWWMDASDLEASVVRLFRDAERHGILDDALKVELALVLHRAASRGDAPDWLAEARAVLSDPSERLRQPAYFEASRKMVAGIALDAADVGQIRQLLEMWPSDWWLNYLGQYAGIAPGPGLLEQRRKALDDLQLAACIEIAVFVLGLIAIVPFLRSLRGMRASARRERRLWRLWRATVTLTLFVAGFGASIAWTLGSNWFFATGFDAEALSEGARWFLWLGGLLMSLVLPVWFLRLSLAGAWGSTGRVFDIRLRSMLSPSNLVTGLAGGLASLWVLMVFGLALWLGGHRFDESLALSRTFAGWGEASFALDVFFGAMLAPFVEEVLFRGFLFNGLKNEWGVRAGVIISSAIFAFAHHYDAAGACGVFIYGMIFCSIYQRTNRLSLAITVHAANNLVLSLIGWLQYL